MNFFKAADKWINKALKRNGHAMEARGAALPLDSAPPKSPNFFIVGAAKAGTTSLWQYLIQHPDIFMPSDIAWKEPSYYCDTYGVEDYAFYLSLFKDAGTRKRIGEASTTYLSSPESPLRIKKAVPEARIIIILRNPVDRAYSMYRWMHAEKYEKLAPFSVALEEEWQSRKDNAAFKGQYSRKGSHVYFRDLLYFHSGLYHDQVKAYIDNFPENQISIILFEEFVKKTAGMMREIYGFLDVDPNFTPEIKIHNEGKSGYGDLAESDRHDLEQRYIPDVRNLSRLINKDLQPVWF